jgi:predicted RND superfamily exporter protein
MKLGRILDLVSRIVTARPWITLAVFAVVTVVFVAGSGFRQPTAPNDAFLPKDSDVARALEEVDNLFSENAGVKPVYVVARGELLDPQALSQLDSLIGAITADPEISGVLPPANAVFAPTEFFKLILGVGDFDTVTQAQVDAAAESMRASPELAAALDNTTGFDAERSPIGLATVLIRDADLGLMTTAQLRANELAGESAGPLAISTVSNATIEEEFQDATTNGTAPLFGVALLVIAVLTFLFLRTISDLVATLAGIFASLMWVVGLEGWLGPDALDLIGPPNALTAMVPIILISLTVDYSIQAIAHYREQRIAGQPAARAVQLGLRNVLIPLTLAAITTLVSFMTNLFSPISAIGDFGVVAGLGVGLSLIVMLTLVPAVRTIIDRRRESRGILKPPRPIAQALPGIDRAAEILGTSIARNATPYILVVALISVGLGYAVTDLETDFGIRDILPADGKTIDDLDAIDAAVGGTSELVNVLVKAEITDTRTFLNVFEITNAFAEEQTRPPAATGPIDASLALEIRRLVDRDSPLYDPELASAFQLATDGLILDPAKIQTFLDLLVEKDPEGVRRVLVNNPDGTDTLLLQFGAVTIDNKETEAMLDDIDYLWYGDDDAINVASPNIQNLAIQKEITTRQTEAIITTIIAALIILVVFFWVTQREPVLGIVAVGPIALVLVWVLGTMALLDIPYTIITSIITALSIGIGVDYTIHVIHRYREEFTKSRDPEDAAIRTLGTVGSALLGSALTTALGFGVLVFSPLESFAQFGIVAAITIAYALIVSILLVPPAMTVWGAFRNMRLQSMVERMWEDLDVAIEETHRRHEGA